METLEELFDYNLKENTDYYYTAGNGKISMYNLEENTDYYYTAGNGKTSMMNILFSQIKSNKSVYDNLSKERENNNQDKLKKIEEDKSLEIKNNILQKINSLDAISIY